MHLFKKKQQGNRNKQHYREILYGEEHQGPPAGECPVPSPALWLSHVIYFSEQDISKCNTIRRIDAFELWCWRRLLRVSWTARRSNQSILKEISPGCSLEGIILKLKLQYFGHLVRRVDSLKKTLMLEGIGGRRKGTTEDEMAGWHHRLDGRESE